MNDVRGGRVSDELKTMVLENLPFCFVVDGAIIFVLHSIWRLHLSAAYVFHIKYTINYQKFPVETLVSSSPYIIQCLFLLACKGTGKGDKDRQ